MISTFPNSKIKGFLKTKSLRMVMSKLNGLWNKLDRSVKASEMAKEQFGNI